MVCKKQPELSSGQATPHLAIEASSLIQIGVNQDFPEELQTLPSRTYPSGPDPDSDPKSAFSGPNRVKIGSGGRFTEGVGFRGVGPAKKAL